MRLCRSHPGLVADRDSEVSSPHPVPFFFRVSYTDACSWRCVMSRNWSDLCLGLSPARPHTKGACLDTSVVHFELQHPTSHMETGRFISQLQGALKAARHKTARTKPGTQKMFKAPFLWAQTLQICSNNNHTIKSDAIVTQVCQGPLVMGTQWDLKARPTVSKVLRFLPRMRFSP